MPVDATFGALPRRARLTLVVAALLLVVGFIAGHRVPALIGALALAGFAWMFHRSHRTRRAEAELEPFPLPADTLAAAEAMARPIDPKPRRTLPPHEKSAMIAAVATTREELSNLIADKPPAWPWAVFTSVLVQRRNAVGDRLRTLASGYQPRPGTVALSAQGYYSSVHPALSAVADLVAELEQFMLSPAFTGAFGNGEADADAEAIVAVATRLMDYHDELLAHVEPLLQTRVDSDALVVVRDFGMAAMAPLIGYQQFITTMCARIGEAQDLLPYTDPDTTIRLDDVRLELDPPKGLGERIFEHIDRITS